jgi:hypothetical protein
LVLVGVAAVSLISLIPPPLDRGPCLRPRVVAYHRDAQFTCTPTIGFDGDIGIDCDTEPARDWTETVCDEWTYPNGKAEQGP